MLLPAATGFGDAALVTLISALETTLATSVALSFARLISPPPDTKAVLVTVEGAVCNTFAVIVIEELLFAAMPGATQLTVWEAIEQDHPVPTAVAWGKPTGRGSFSRAQALLGTD